MAEDFNDIRRNVSAFLISLRHSIDRPYRNRVRPAYDDREIFMKTILMVEEARVRFSTYTRYRAEPTVSEWNQSRKDLNDFVDRFIESEETDPDVFDRPFISAPVINRDMGNTTDFIRSIQSDKTNRLSISEALFTFKSYLNNGNVASPAIQENLSFGELGRIIPSQQVAPVQFDIVENIIVISNKTPKTLHEDRSNIAAALEHIKHSGNKLIESLERSNCDRRLLETVQHLQSQLIEESNIVKIGLTNMASGVMCARFNDELPDAVAAMFNSYSSSVSLYVAQFPEWEQFTQKAALIDLDEDDVADVDNAAGELIDALNADPSLSDPEVPKTIAFVRQFLAFPGASSKRAAFAMIRTIENLVSSIIKHSISFAHQTASKTVETASSTASKVIVSLLGVAFISASGIGPAAVNAGAPWVKQAAEIVKKQIEKSAE